MNIRSSKKLRMRFLILKRKELKLMLFQLVFFTEKERQSSTLTFKKLGNKTQLDYLM